MLTLTKKATGKLIGRRFAEPFAMAAADYTPGAPQGIIARSDRVDQIARAALSSKLSQDPGIRYGDAVYYLPTVQEVQHILSASQLDRRQWLQERFDCDDFAYVLKGEMSAHAYDAGELRFGLCVGMVWGNFDWVTGYHAVNWFIAADERLRFIEPQSDGMYDAQHCQGNISLFLV
jgi:hypothetical protein